jgi:hypothetical protein
MLNFCPSVPGRVEPYYLVYFESLKIVSIFRQDSVVVSLRWYFLYWPGGCVISQAFTNLLRIPG